MDLVVYDDDDHRYVPWGVVLSALLAVATVVGALTFLLGRSASQAAEIGGVSALEPATAPSSASPAASSPASSPSPAGSAAPSCADALTRADDVLERSQRIAQALAEHTRLMDELLAQRLDTQQALDQTLPVLTEGATERRLFAQELEDYQRSRQECPRP